MLVLSRKQGEEIVIGDNICITVVEVSGGRVRLGLTAPADVPILRKELDLDRERCRGRPATDSSHARRRQDGGVQPDPCRPSPRAARP